MGNSPVAAPRGKPVRASGLGLAPVATGAVSGSVSCQATGEAQLRLLVSQLGGMMLVTAGAGLACGLAAYAASGVSGVWVVLAAVAGSIPTGVAVLGYFSSRGVTPRTLVVGMLLRVVTTMFMAGVLVLVFPTFRTPVFFLAVAVIYLANLVVETWFAYEQNRQAGQRASSV